MATNNAVNVGLSGSTGTGSFVGSDSPTFTGTVVIPTPFTLGATSVTSTGTNLNLLSGASQTLVQRVSSETGAVATGTTTIPFDDTIPQNTEGDQYMSLAITPKSSSNILVIQVLANCSSSGTTDSIAMALFQDTTANSLATTWQGGFAATAPSQLSLTHVMTAGTTSSTTFKVRIGQQGAGTLTFNGSGGTRYFGGVMASSISIYEYTP